MRKLVKTLKKETIMTFMEPVTMKMGTRSQTGTCQIVVTIEIGREERNINRTRNGNQQPVENLNLLLGYSIDHF